MLGFLNERKKFILGMLLLILLAFAVIYNQVIRFEIARYEVIAKNDLSDSEVNFHFPREDYEYTTNSLDNNLKILNYAEDKYLLIMKAMDIFLLNESLSEK